MSLRIFFLGLITGGCLLLQADVIYSNFGVDNGYAVGSGLIASNDAIAGASVAIGFTPTDNYDLTSIEFVASSFIPGGTGASIGIFADNGGHPGSTALESFSLDGLLGQFGSAVPVLTVTSQLQPFLQANTLYWIAMQGPAGGLAIWNLNSTFAAGISSTDGAGHWLASDAPQGALEIDGTVAPAPVVPIIVDPGVDPESVFQASLSQAPLLQDTQETEALTPEPHSAWLLAGGLFAILAAYELRARFTHQK